MIFVWIFAVSLLLYMYYSMRITARITALQTADLSPGFPATPAGVVDAPAPALEPGPEAEHDYLDMEAMTLQTQIRGPDDVPVVHIPASAEGYYLGGAAGGHANMEISGTFEAGAAAYTRGERRQTPRRGEERRGERGRAYGADKSEEGRRLIQRRTWLRRQTDQERHDLLDIREAAEILSSTPEAIEKWIMTADLPFYMVTKGAVREKRFDRIELLGWLGAEDVIEARARLAASEAEDETT